MQEEIHYLGAIGEYRIADHKHNEYTIVGMEMAFIKQQRRLL
jgi:hypothetical protein